MTLAVGLVQQRHGVDNIATNAETITSGCYGS